MFCSNFSLWLWCIITGFWGLWGQESQSGWVWVRTGCLRGELDNCGIQNILHLLVLTLCSLISAAKVTWEGYIEAGAPFGWKQSRPFPSQEEGWKSSNFPLTHGAEKVWEIILSLPCRYGNLVFYSSLCACFFLSKEKLYPCSTFLTTKVRHQEIWTDHSVFMEICISE